MKKQGYRKDLLNQSELMRTLRERHGLTQRQVAISLGIKPQYLSYMETGFYGISKNRIQIISEFFEVDKKVIIDAMVRDYAIELESY